MKEKEQEQVSKLVITLPLTLKEEFKKIAKEQDSDATKVVRIFIKKYVAKHRKGVENG